MRKHALYLLSLILMSALFSFTSQPKKMVRYLPLGDSYTICTGATQNQSWPYLLTGHLNAAGIPCTLTGNPARNGFTTQDLIDRELPLLKELRPDFVTVLIGVNDWVRGVPKVTFNKNLVHLLDAVQTALPDKSKVLLVTIPDFGVTPQGKEYANGRNINQGISEFNTIIEQEAKKRNLPVVDIFALTQKMGDDASLIAKDGLHPSAKEYGLWEAVILPETVKLLR